MREENSDVIVVGAGPVGLVSALLLTEAGIQAQIIDSEPRTTARSYGCALHPRTLKLLDSLGLAKGAIERGRRVEKVAYYEGDSRKAEANLKAAGGEFPFLLILPQNAFEDLLEQRLNQKGVQVSWNHRFNDVREEQDSLSVEIERLAGTSTGYIVPHWEVVVQKRFSTSARFVIGADGHNSLLRQRLGLESVKMQAPQLFAAYEFETDAMGADEIRVVLDEATTSVLWPLPGNHFRWTFQLVKTEFPTEFPDKERRDVRVEQKQVEQDVREYIQKLARHRAPWFKAKIGQVTWHTDVVFEHTVAKKFGRGRCWLAGDAAHQTGPVGAQSMNVGITEAASLVNLIKQVLKNNAPLASLEQYDKERQAEWSRLLSPNGLLASGAQASPWIRSRMSRLVECLPGSGEELSQLAAQLGFEIKKS